MRMPATEHPGATRRFTADEVWRMVEIGLLGEDEPYELLDGELLYVSPQGPAHADAIRELTSQLVLAYGPDYRVGAQLPIAGIVDAIPEPDLAVAPRDAASSRRHLRAELTVLIVEIADTSLPRDIRKGAVYAAAGAPVFWIVDLNRNAVTVHEAPQPDGTWRQVHEVGPNGRLALPGIDGTIEVATLVRPPG